jgi:riboflavin synthase alpha subunit
LFTGIIEELGTVASRRAKPGVRLTVQRRGVLGDLARVRAWP